jgi:DNA methylase
VVTPVARRTTGLLAAPDPDEPNRLIETGATNLDHDEPHRADPAAQRRLSVWVTAQSTGPMQRRGRYVPDSVKHPARMLPAIAAHAINAYTQPGDLVLDPMCGIGTTLVEAVHLGATRSVSSTSPSGATSPTRTSPTPTPKAPPAGPRWCAATPPASPSAALAVRVPVAGRRGRPATQARTPINMTHLPVGQRT